MHPHTFPSPAEPSAAILSVSKLFPLSIGTALPHSGSAET